MELVIKRSLSPKGYIYKFDNKSSIVGFANYTFGLTFRKIVVKINDVTCHELRQNNLFLKLIDLIPIINFFNFVPFNYYYNNKINGKTEKSPIHFDVAYYITIFNDEYEIRGHSDNIISITKNNIQICVINKDHLIIAEDNTYRITAVNNIDKELLMLFLVFIDVTLYPNKNLGLIKYEHDIVFNDEYKERTNWKP